MSTDFQGNAQASSNGVEMENIIRALYPGAEFSYKGVIDFTINGTRTEIKSCQDRVKDSHNSGGVRSGRFCFTELQHKQLIEEAGEYIFLVHRAGIPFIYFRVPACYIDLGDFSGVKSVCWKTLLQGAVC